MEVTQRIAIVMLLAGAVFGQITEDRENSKDHPLLTRQPGYFITSYDEQEFSVYEFPLGDGKYQKVEGQYWEFEYDLGEGKKKAGPLQISRNYANAIVGKGGVKLYERVDAQSGDTTLKFPNGGKSLWVHLALANSGEFYKMYVVEETQFEQKVEFTAPTLAKTLEEKGSVNLNSILFDTGTSTLRPESQATLAALGGALQSLDSSSFELRGHTDNVGSAAANQRLSLARAEAVKAYLVKNFNVDAKRLSTAGLGDTQPVASNSDEAGRQLNRRVEVVKK